MKNDPMELEVLTGTDELCTGVTYPNLPLFFYFISIDWSLQNHYHYTAHARKSINPH